MGGVVVFFDLQAVKGNRLMQCGNGQGVRDAHVDVMLLRLGCSDVGVAYSCASSP